MSNVIADRRREWGASRVYGHSGGGVNGMLETIRHAIPQARGRVQSRG